MVQDGARSKMTYILVLLLYNINLDHSGPFKDEMVQAGARSKMT